MAKTTTSFDAERTTSGPGGTSTASVSGTSTSTSGSGSGAGYGNSSGGSRSSGSSSTRGRASGVADKASQQIDNAPLIAVGAGAALGAVLGAVLPISRKEKEMLAPLGTKLTNSGYSAVDRARDMGKQKFDEMAGDKVREFLGIGGGSSGSSSNSSSTSNG